MAWGTTLAGTIVTNAAINLFSPGVVLTPNGSTAEGDLMMAVCFSSGGGNAVWDTISGWTKVFSQQDNPGVNKWMSIHLKYAGASEGSSTFTTDKNEDETVVAVILTFVSGHATDQLDVTYSELLQHQQDIR